MASNNKRRIDYTVGFTVDKTGLTDLQRQLDTISKMSNESIRKINPGLSANEVAKIAQSMRVAVDKIKPALDKAFDTKTGVMNLNTLKNALNKLDLDDIGKRLNAMGPMGQQAFANITKAALTSNVQLKQTSSLLQKMGETLMNTFRWSIASSVLNKFTGSVQQAWGYVQHLDTSLNDIRIVTGKSADEMERFAEKANKAAQALGKSTTDYTEASLIYYQQGLSDEEVAARTETTLKAASVTGQSTKAVSEELTAVWNGYRVTAEGTEEAVDKLAAVAATTAADLQELSTGMSKVAAAANTMGVDMDQLNATLATIESVTRQAPESVGTALKTIYARMGDLKIGGEDEDGLKLGDVASTLQNVGIEILDVNGDLKDMGTIVEEIAEKWNTWTKAQQTAVAESVAGKRQYNNLFALFENWDMYLDALETSRNATGTLQQQQDIYMESTAAHVKQLKTEWEDLYDSILDTSDINSILTGLTNILNLITKIIDGIGGGKTLLLGIVSLLTGPMSKVVSDTFSPLLLNRQAQKQNEIILEQLTRNIDLQRRQKVITTEAAAEMTKLQHEMSKYWDIMSEEEINASQATIREIGDWKTKQQTIEETKKKLDEYITQSNLSKTDKNSFLTTNADGKSSYMIAGSAQNREALQVIQKQQQSLRFLNDDLDNIEQKYRKWNETLKGNLSLLRTQGQLTPSIQKTLKDIEGKYRTINYDLKEIDKLKNKGIISKESANESTKRLTEVKNRLEEIINQIKGVSETTPLKGNLKIVDDSTVNALHRAKQEIDYNIQSLDEFDNVIRNGNIGIEEAVINTERLTNSLKMEELQTRENVQTVSEFISSITSLAFGVSSITRSIEALNDTSLDSSEQFTQFLTGMLFGIPMLIKGIKSLITTTVELSEAFFGLKLSVSTITPWFTAIIIGLTALSAVLKNNEKELERIAENSKEYAKSQQEIIDKTKEEKDAINELNNSYENLLKQREDDTTFTKEQQAEVYNLVKAYGDQELIIQALAGDYDNLQKAIKGAQKAANDKLVSDLEEGNTRYEAALKDSLISQASITERDAGGFDLSGLGGLQRHEDFRQDLAALIGEPDDVIDESGHISWEDLEKVLTADTKDLQEFLKKYEDLKASTQIRELLSQNNELINSLKDNTNSLKESKLNQLGYENLEDLDAIKDFADYEKTLQRLATEAVSIGEDSEDKFSVSYDEGIKWARDFLSGYSDELAGYDKKADLAQALIDAITPEGSEASQEIVDAIYQKIGQVDEGSLSYIASHVAIFKALINSGKEVEDVFNSFNASIEAASRKDHIITIDTVIDKNFAKKEVNELFADETFDIGISQPEFENLSEGDKYFALLQKKQEEIAQIERLTEAEKQEILAHEEYLNKEIEREQGLLTTLYEQRTELETEVGEQNQKLQEDFYKTFGEDTQIDFDDFANRYDEVITKLQEIYQAAVDEGKDGVQAVVDSWSEVVGEDSEITQFFEQMTYGYNSDALESMIKSWKTGSSQLDDLNDEIERSEQNIADLENEYRSFIPTSVDYVKQVAELKAGISALNKDIDNIQSSYQSLQSIMEEYNETGTLSLDNLQTLLAMDDSYVASLELQNGQMTMNEEITRAMIDAKLQQARVEATELYMNELNAIAMGQNVTASQMFYDAEHQYTISAINDVITACDLGVEALNELAVAKAATLKDSAATQEVTQAYYNRMQLINSVAAQPTSQLLGKADKSKKSGSGSSKEPEQKKHEEHEIDIYRTINKELEQIESTLGRIQKINDHEWGIDAQKTLEEENKLLDQQLEKLEEKRGLQERDLSTRRKQLEDIGVSFTADGSAMTNAEEKLDQLYNQYNSMIDHYNSLSVEGQEAYKAELEAEKDKIDKIEKKMDEYESGFSEYQSTLDKILDTHYEAIANEINQFNNMIDVHLELNDAQKEWDKFWSEVVEDVRDTDFAGQIAASMKQLETLVGTPFKNADSDVAVLTNHLKDTVAEVQAQIASANRGGEDSLFGDDTLASKENLTKYRDALMDALRNAKEEIDNISETYLKMLDDAQDKIDKQVDGWNSIGDQIEHDVELIKLISGDKAYDALAGFYEQQYQNNLKLINTQKQSQDFWKSQIDIYKQLLATTDESSVEWQTYDEALRKSVENYRKATQDLDKTVQESIKDLQTWRENNVNAITDTLDKAMSKGLGLDLVEQEWKLINDYADQYYDNVERALNMQEYTNILDDAANAVGLTAENQEKLNNFRREELAQLNEKEKLTQYDIDESKARLEILKAEIALQDAQRNKSNMRLRRDNQGNYVYQYTGNDQDIEKAENGMLTAKREWYELVKKRNKETNDYIIQLSKERIDLQNQLAQAQMDGDVERINLLLDLIKRNEEQQVEAFAWAEDAKQDLIKGTAIYFADVENHDVLPMFEATVNHLVDRWAGDDDSFIKASITAVQKLQTTQDEYAARTKVVLTEAGINYQELREEQIDPTIDSLNEMVASNEELADELDNVNDLLREQESNLRDVEYAYYSLRSAAVSAISAAQSALNTLANTAINTVQRVQAAIQAANNTGSIASNMANNYVRSSGSGVNNQNSVYNPNKNKTIKNSTSNLYTLQPDVGGTVAVYYNGKKKEQVTVKALQSKYNPYEFGVSNWDNIFDFDELTRTLQWYGSTFATGGYTGSWGNSGKLAMLHEKELVLNKDDTSNILKAVNAIREVVQAANTSKISNNLLNSSNISAGILSRISAGFLQGAGNITTSNANSSSNMVINADFSGVRNADEIYQALLELQNYGLQQNYSVEPNINIGY